MKIIGFINQKGGVGKTTFILNTAFALAKMNKKVFILDTDNQASVCNFMDFREKQGIETSIDYTSSQVLGIKTNLKQLSNSYDYLLIDTAGSASSDILKATEFMDNIIVPVQSSWLDINSASAFITALMTTNANKKFKILINGVNTNSMSIAQELYNYFKNENIDVFKSYICNRKPYKDSIYMAKSIVETLEDKDNCLIEFNKYIKELLEWIGE